MLPALFLLASLVNDVRGLIAHHDFASAERTVRTYQSQAGATSEVAAAFSWLARGAVDNKQYDQAEKYAVESRKIADGLLRGHRLDADPWLPTAVGASIEVQAQVMAARGERTEAVAYLRKQAAVFGATSIGERIRKNVNLLNMVGKPAPELESQDFIGPKPASLASLKGHPVLMFFWAHWCGDCKGDAAIIAQAMQTYGPKGLVVVAPTRFYGYIAGGMDATPGVERAYIERVKQQYYPMLSNVASSISANNFLTYGASTTPTVVLLDSAGVVRWYHPGAVTALELSTQIEKVLRPTAP